MSIFRYIKNKYKLHVLRDEFESTRECYKHINLKKTKGNYVNPVIQKEWFSFISNNKF